MDRHEIEQRIEQDGGQYRELLIELVAEEAMQEVEAYLPPESHAMWRKRFRHIARIQIEEQQKGEST